MSQNSAKLRPIVTSRSSSLDKVQLVGQLDPNSLATLEVQEGDGLSNKAPAHPMKIALEIASQSRHGSVDNTSESASEEDYDTLQYDPQTVIPGGRGGGYHQDEKPTEARIEKSFQQIKSEQTLHKEKNRPTISRLKSIPVALQKSHQEGKYFLIAGDEELKHILHMSIEREKGLAPSKQRKKFSDLVFTRQFTAFDRHNSISAESPFHGFFTLFWLGTAIFMIQTALNNWILHGNILGTNEIMRLMLHRDLMVLGLSDGIMCAATGFGWILQRLILKGSISWNKEGWIIQNLWQIFFMFAAIFWTLFREWPWTHTVFFVLHSLAMIMKQHSYAFYNGHLSEEYKSRIALMRRLKELQNTAPIQSPSATSPAISSLSTSYLDERPSAAELNQRRHSRSTKVLHEGLADVAQVAAAIESGEPLDTDQIILFERIIKWEIDALSEDLKGKSTKGGNGYPHNLTFANHYEFIVLPTLVYELEYPRSDKIDWYYVAEKAVATAGIFIIMMLVSQTFIYPVVVRTIEIKDSGMPLHERLQAFPWILSDLIFPFMMEYMMAWYIIWECILNLLAELTFFADRGFYSAWWNSVSWDNFARDWNRPVHNFLLRHVYHSSISSMKVNKYSATLITFFLSACVHELVMWCIFKKLRGYLLFFQMMQLPLVQLSRSRFMRGRATLGNLIFWIGIFTGPSLLCSLYLVL